MTRNYILGRGETLVRHIGPPRIKPNKAHPYGVLEARERLLPRIRRTANDLKKLPDSACPQDQAVVSLVIHPAYLAKSYYPREFLEDAGLRVVGSRATTVKPEKVATNQAGEPCLTAEFFVASSRRAFAALPGLVSQLDLESPAADRLRQFEDVHEFNSKSKLRNIPPGTDYPWLEIVLHAGEETSYDYIIEGFRGYLNNLGIQADIDKRLYAGALCFLPLKAPRILLGQIARFSFLRVARGMPQLRPPLVTRTTASPLKLGSKAVPAVPPVDPDVRIAVFDGGVGAAPVIGSFVKSHESKDLGKPVPSYEEHGHMVTGAVLFGPIDEPDSLPVPYGMVDHYRVLDERTNPNDDQLFDVIKRIEAAITEQRPEFMVLSVGPEMVVDDEPHVWTSTLDQLLADGDILAAIAVGNGGEGDRDLGLHRIQVPSDCVNALSVGACDARGEPWARAPYSSMGPGRSPGIVKPDVLAFGGCATEPFYVVSQRKPGFVLPQSGTSFAGPVAMRTAVGVRACFGPLVMTPLVLKALLVNRSKPNQQSAQEIGWGRIEEDVEALTTCANNEAVIIYQGALRPGKYWEAEIPWPDGAIAGNVEIAATFCFACQTDPEHPIHYTRAGLEVVFRPHAGKRARDANLPASEPLFGKIKAFAKEQEQRQDAHKWETTIHGVKRKRAGSLHRPLLQIHYNAREGGSAANAAKSVPYALVLTVRARDVGDFYDRIVTKYRNRLEVLQPIRVPVRISK